MCDVDRLDDDPIGAVAVGVDVEVEDDVGDTLLARVLDSGSPVRMTRGLALPDMHKLEQLQRDGAALQEGQALAEARLQELDEQVQTLDEQRRTQAQTAATESSRQAELGARLEALRALQDKVQSSGKLKPWLVKHGLDSLQGLWTRVHIEPGWETALEAALRERLAALEVGRLETVRAFAADAPPARLAFYSTGVSAHADTHRTLPRLSELLQLDDAGFRKLFSGSPIKRIGRDRFVRNCLYAAGNSGNPALTEQVAALTQDPDPVVAEAAQWALARLR